MFSLKHAGPPDQPAPPPFPMKIAAPDGGGRPDNRFVRAETCMFMIKLPQYVVVASRVLLFVCVAHGIGSISRHLKLLG
jgi:hypothetical protein